MRKFISLSVIVVTLIVACSLHAQTSRFAKYEGHSPRELFAGERDVTDRVGAILGRDYKLFMRNLDTQTTFDVYHGIMYATGCQAHNCGGSENAILLIDLATGSIHCALHTGRDPAHFITYSEDADHLPREVLRNIINDLGD